MSWLFLTKCGCLTLMAYFNCSRNFNCSNTHGRLFSLVYEHYIMSIPKTSGYVFPVDWTHFTFFGVLLRTVWTVASFLACNCESMFYQHNKSSVELCINMSKHYEKFEFVSWCWQLTNTTPITHWHLLHTLMFM